MNRFERAPLDRTPPAALVAVAALFTFGACGGEDEEPEPTGEPCYPTTVEAARCDPATATFSLASTNRFYPLIVGAQTVLEGRDPMDNILVRVERTVLARTERVAGVETHVLEHKTFHDGQIHEIAYNFYVEASDGTVCYFGEDVEFYEGGMLVNRNGTWRADGAMNKPGIIMPAAPAVGDAYFQENAPAIAIDMGRVSETGGTMMLGGMTYTDTVTVLDVNPLDSCEDTEPKRYVPGIGEVGDVYLSLVSHTPGT